MDARRLNELMRTLSLRPGTVVYSSRPSDRPTKTTPKLQGHFAPSSAALSTLAPIFVSELTPENRHFGRVLFLDLLTGTEDDGLLLKATDLTGAACNIWLLVLHPVFVGRQKAAGPDKTLTLAVKEPYYSRSPVGKLCIRLDHPMDAEFVASYRVTNGFAVKGDTSFSATGDRAFLDGDSKHAMECYSHGIARSLQSLLPGESRKEVLEFLSKRAFIYTRLGNFKGADSDAEAMLAIDPANCKALRLSITCKLRLQCYGNALFHARTLSQLDGSKAMNDLLVQIQARLAEQTSGLYEFARMLERSHTRTPSSEVATFCRNVEKRRSLLGGYGLFAISSFKPGDLILCERPFAITSHTDETPTRDEVYNVLLDTNTSRRKLALLQKLADKTVRDPASLASLFALCDGTSDEARDEPLATFDSYRALRIIKRNAHSVFSGALSDQHSLYDPGNTTKPKHLLQASEQQLGIWLKASLFNHSCVPNVFWAFIGDAIVARAIRQIDADDELTIAYIPSDTSAYQRRKDGLEAYQIDCTCPLCKADVKFGKSRQRLDRLTPVPRTSPDAPARSTYGPDAKKALLEAVKSALQTYDPVAYFGKHPPAVSLASPFVQIAHDILGPVATWSRATEIQTDTATKAFRSCLVLGLALHVVISITLKSQHLVRGPYCQPKAAGVIALVGLAELAYHAQDTQRCTALLAHARQLYEICYGESGSLKESHGDYQCMKVEAVVEPNSEVEPAMDTSTLFENEVRELLAFWQTM